ncbi:hypothetical protein KU6B_03150 [Mameliella alba]|nr:hypothetical protein KU6B_03150 [Mameliella alba]
MLSGFEIAAPESCHQATPNSRKVISIVPRTIIPQVSVQSPPPPPRGGVAR